MSNLDTIHGFTECQESKSHTSVNINQSSANDPSHETIRTALAALRPSGLQNLVAIPLVGPPIGATFDLPAQLDEAADWTANQNAAGHNLYFTVNLVSERVHGKPTKTHIAAAEYAHVDIDPDVTNGYAEGRDRLLNETLPELQAFTPAPSFIIDSGNGLGCFWRLDGATVQEAEDLNRRLIVQFGGDPGTYNIDRLMRLPGTLNYPTKTKLAKGYPEAPSSARLLPACDATYPVAALADVLPAVALTTPALPVSADPPDLTPLTPEDIQALDARLAVVLDQSPSLRRRWHGETNGLQDTSRSGLDFSVTALLKATGFSYPETAHLLRHSFKHGKGTENTERDLQRNWTRCGTVSPAEIYAVCSEARQRGDRWEEALYATQPNEQTVDAVLDQLAQEKDSSGKRVLKADYEVFATSRVAEAAEQQVIAQAGNRLALLWDPRDMNAMTDRVEDALRTIPGRWEVLLYGGVHSCVAVKPPQHMVSLDEQGAKPPCIPVFEPYNRDSMYLRIEQSVACYSQDKGKAVAIRVPRELPGLILNKPDPDLPTTMGLVSHPLLLRTGELLINEGLHEASGIYVHFGGSTFAAPDDLTPEESAAILQTEMLGEFPFASAADEGAALALILTAIERKTMDMAPAFMINAATQGSGKTTLARMVHLLVTGQDMPVTAMTENADEQEKALTAMLLQSVPIVCFDNVPDGFKVDSPALAKALTSLTHTGRILGLSKMATLPTNTVFVVTGNNITASIDLTRRLLEVRLAPKEARPEQRRFQQPDVAAYVLRNRSRWMQAALAVLSGNRQAQPDAPPSGFSQWDRMVRWPLVNAGVTDPVAKFDAVRDNSPDLERLTAWMLGLAHGYGEGNSFRASDLERSPNDCHHIRDTAGLEAQQRKIAMYTDYLDGHPPTKGWGNVKSISWMLAGLVERTIEGYKLTRKTIHGTAHYTVVRVGPGG